MYFDKFRVYIYSSLFKWGLKRYDCTVKYYTEETLPDLDFVICSIVATGNNGQYDKRNLGIILGFCIVDRQPDLYYDHSEVKLFDDFLSLVEKDHLIIVDENSIKITNLGRISLANNTLYRFYTGHQDIYEHFSFSYPPNLAGVSLMFPFYKDMGIFTELRKEAQYWPDDADIPSILGKESNQLIDRIQLQSKENSNVYEAEISKYFDIEVKQVPIRLYTKNGDYCPIVYNGGKIALKATKLFDFQENELQRENAILECLFRKLWDDRSAILNYDSLELYFELVDYEELTKDSRIEWSDEKLFLQIVKKANSNCWLNISNNCDINVLYGYLKSYVNNLNWDVVTLRVEDDFLLKNFKDYPWDLEVISNDTTKDISFIEQLIILKGEYSDEWDWAALGQRLEETFVLSNLSLVNIDLAEYTKDVPKVRECLLHNPEKNWNWEKAERVFELEFLLENILLIHPYIRFTQLFDRIFSNAVWADKYINDLQFVEAVEENIANGGSLSSLVFNQKKYIWSDNLINKFENWRLISWPTTQYTLGFECNSALHWTKDFFSKYFSKVSTQVGRDYVSSNIEDESIVLEYKNFDWNWTKLSANPNISTDFIKQNQIFPWNWSVLTKRLFSSIENFNNIGHPLFISKWNWTYFSENLPKEFIWINLEKYAEYWDWNKVLDRLITKENRLDIGWLAVLASSMNLIKDSFSKKSAWSFLSGKYSYNELKLLLKQTHSDERFVWDISLLYDNAEFNVFFGIPECSNFIDWEILSYSKSIDEKLIFDTKSGITETSWNKDVKQLIINYKDYWNFNGLSKFESLNDKHWFLSKFSRVLDWEYISLHSLVFTVKEKQQLSKVISEYKRYISFRALSNRQDIDIIQIMKICPKAEYDYNALIINGKWEFTIKDITSRLEYSWDWRVMSSAKIFEPTADFLIDFLSKNWDWYALTQKDLQKVWSSKQLILKMSSNTTIVNSVDWMTLTSRPYFPVEVSILASLPTGKVNWEVISDSKVVMDLLENFANDLDWQIVSRNKKFDVSDISILKKYADKIDWNIVCRRDDFTYTADILAQFTDKLNWMEVSKTENIDFTVSLVDKYIDYWDWSNLIKNKAFFNNVEIIQEKKYIKQKNISSFINSFPRRPMAYHFTHMSNAVKIIKSQMLQSRNRAKGVFENSAGNNVDRIAKAHCFARFYFTCKSPNNSIMNVLAKTSMINITIKHIIMVCQNVRFQYFSLSI